MLEMRGPEIYLYYPEGVGRSKLSGAVIENKLDTAGTARNWNTLAKLLETGRALERSARAAALRRMRNASLERVATAASVVSCVASNISSKMRSTAPRASLLCNP